MWFIKEMRFDVSEIFWSGFSYVKWSLERASVPRPAAYEAAALPGWAIEAHRLCLLISETQVFKCFIAELNIEKTQFHGRRDEKTDREKIIFCDQNQQQELCM